MSENEKKYNKVCVLLDASVYERLRKVCYLNKLRLSEVGRLGFEQAILDLEEALEEK